MSCLFLGLISHHGGGSGDEHRHQDDDGDDDNNDDNGSSSSSSSQRLLKFRIIGGKRDTFATPWQCPVQSIFRSFSLSSSLPSITFSSCDSFSTPRRQLGATTTTATTAAAAVVFVFVCAVIVVSKQ